VIKLEQLNIVGKRSGEGFVAHKAMLVSTLSRALSARLVLMDLTIGLKGLLGYLKALGGSNVVKMIPSNGSASGSQANGHKRLKVICGANTSYLADNEWIGEKTPLTLCEVRVSPVNTVTPNVGASELAEALARVLPFTAREDNRPVLQCVLFKAGDGKLTLVSADGFRLAVIGLDFDGEGQALINRDDLKGVVNALKRAKRARVSFEGEDVTKTSSLIIDTELIRYKWASVDGSYPDYEKLIPTEFNIFAHFDTVEAVKAVNSLKALSEGKSYPIDLTISDGMITMANPDDKGQADIPADTDGQGFVRIDGQYLADALRACGGMVDFKLNNAYSPMLFTVDGYQLVVMPMLTDKANQQAKADSEAVKAEAEPTEPAESQPVAEKTEPAKPKKAKHSKAKEPVAVA
jgi:DNA polymerase-3 subunit beta